MTGSEASCIAWAWPGNLAAATPALRWPRHYARYWLSLFGTLELWIADRVLRVIVDVVLCQVVSNKLTYHLRWSQVLAGAKLVERFFLAWIDQDGKAGGLVFHDSKGR